MEYIFTTAILLFLVMDPLGNLPFFINTLKKVPPERHVKIILREAVIALLVLAVFLCFGRKILALLQISQASLGIAGGIILFLIALKMIFGTPNGQEHKTYDEPLIVPLAIPMIAGPSSVATVILIRGSETATLGNSALALFIAWAAGTVILVFSTKLEKLLGQKFLDAAESLMGLLLTALAIEMLIKGIKSSFFS
jgi:MarC family membrane protein